MTLVPNYPNSVSLWISSKKLERSLFKSSRASLSQQLSRERSFSNQRNHFSSRIHSQGDLAESFSYQHRGGYLFSPKLFETVKEIQQHWHNQYNITLIIEPSYDISNSAGYLVTSIVDIFKAHGKTFAVVDTTTNHFPEVLEAPEYYPIHVMGSAPKYSNSYILVGATVFVGGCFWRAPF